MDKIIVLETAGKREDVDYVKIKLFNSMPVAEKYCKDTSDKDEDKKYWTHAEIVKEGVQYEVARYENFS